MSHESTEETWTDRFVRPTLPMDLAVVVTYVFLAVVLLTRPVVYGTPVAVALGIPALFFAPGYALVSFLFPGATPDDADRTVAEVRQHGLTGGERIALGFGISVASLPILGVALALSPWAIGSLTALLSVAGVTILFAVAGAIRRLQRPPDRRFSVSVRAWVRDRLRSVVGGSVTDSLLDVGLALAVVFAVAAIGYAVAVPGPGQNYTSVSLLTENETGELVAEGYPETIEKGTSAPLVVELTNHEGEQVRYSVVVELQRVEQTADGEAKVLEDTRLATFQTRLDAGETWRRTHEVTPTMTGEDLRLVYLVYRADQQGQSADPTIDDAYRYVHVWVSVTEGAN